MVSILIFVGASAAATSFVATYLLALYGAAAGGIYGLASLAETTAMAQRIATHRQQQRIRPHIRTNFG
jgi:hypothetical protein